MSNAEPPEWVVELVVKHIDTDGNGAVTLAEWWAFLESIGFENVTPKMPEEPTPVEEPVPTPAPVSTPVPEPTPAPAPAEVAPVAAVASVAAVAATTAAVVPSEPQPVAPSPSVVASAPVTEPAPEPEASTGGLDHMSIIEALSGARLLSEFNEIVDRSAVQTSTIKVQKTERSLMASGEYRGGQTITGTLDGGEHVVTMRFPVSETEFIESLKVGQVVTSEGKIYRWSGALKQANLECTNARIA